MAPLMYLGASAPLIHQDLLFGLSRELHRSYSHSDLHQVHQLLSSPRRLVSDSRRSSALAFSTEAQPGEPGEMLGEE